MHPQGVVTVGRILILETDTAINRHSLARRRLHRRVAAGFRRCSRSVGRRGRRVSSRSRCSSFRSGSSCNSRRRRRSSSRRFLRQSGLRRERKRRRHPQAGDNPVYPCPGAKKFHRVDAFRVSNIRDGGLPRPSSRHTPQIKPWRKAGLGRPIGTLFSCLKRQSKKNAHRALPLAHLATIRLWALHHDR